MKKAVSPLIATVLLVAFAVSIGSVVMNFGDEYIKKQTENSETSSNLKLQCSQNVYLELMRLNNMKSYCYYNDSQNLTITIKLRKGTKDINGIRTTIVSNMSIEYKDYNKNITTTGFQLNLNGFSKNLIVDNKIESIELVPYFLLFEGNKYTCPGSKLIITDIEKCNGEIPTSVTTDAQTYGEEITSSTQLEPEIPEAQYTLGENGPAGGKIIHVKNDYLDGWRYIEIFPFQTQIESGFISDFSGEQFLVGKNLVENSNYGGFNDWEVPTLTDFENYIIPNRNIIGGYSSSNYWTSTISSTNNYFAISISTTDNIVSNYQTPYIFKPIRKFSD